jgi:four helix bundle protein
LKSGAQPPIWQLNSIESPTSLTLGDFTATPSSCERRGISLSNNIAEGSGSTHKQEFIQFLNIARRSLFEDASMLLVFEKLGLLESAEVDELLWACDELSRKITNFSRAL